MKNIISIIIVISAIFFASACGNTSENGDSLESVKKPVVKIEESIHDFGKILQGEQVSHTFTIKNIGNDNLIIENVRSSCGCTTTNVTTVPIKPGETGSVEVSFDSAGRKGKQTKAVTIWTNAKPTSYRIKITSEVVIPNN